LRPDPDARGGAVAGDQQAQIGAFADHALARAARFGQAHGGATHPDALAEQQRIEGGPRGQIRQRLQPGRQEARCVMDMGHGGF